MSNVLHVVCFDERRYTITDTKLGEGSQGTILSGKDEDNNCVAIKIVRFSSPKAQAQFQYEKFITNKIMEANDDTSGLCVFLGVQEQQEWGIMVMNQYETDLFNFLFEINFQPKLNETPAKSVFRNICQGLKSLHSQGIAHLDLKLENILFNVSSHLPFLCDLGSSIYIPQCDAHKPFVAHNVGVRGTLEYYSPELLRNASSYDPFKVDIYALGVILHIIVTGLYPYLIELREREALLDVARQEVSSSCVNLLESMLDNDPAKRPSIYKVLAHPWLSNQTNKKSKARRNHYLSLSARVVPQRIASLLPTRKKL